MPTPTELTDRLMNDLQNQSIYVDGITGMVSPYNPATIQVTPSNLQSVAQPLINVFDGSQAAQDAWVQRVTEYRNRCVAFMASPDPDARAYRAVAALTIDEINTLRQWLASFKAQVALASTFADLKTRVATLPATPDRTLAQAKTAFIAKVNAGT